MSETVKVTSQRHTVIPDKYIPDAADLNIEHLLKVYQRTLAGNKQSFNKVYNYLSVIAGFMGDEDVFQLEKKSYFKSGNDNEQLTEAEASYMRTAYLRNIRTADDDQNHSPLVTLTKLTQDAISSSDDDDNANPNIEQDREDKKLRNDVNHSLLVTPQFRRQNGTTISSSDDDDNANPNIEPSKYSTLTEADRQKRLQKRLRDREDKKLRKYWDQIKEEYIEEYIATKEEYAAKTAPYMHSNHYGLLIYNRIQDIAKPSIVAVSNLVVDDVLRNCPRLTGCTPDDFIQSNRHSYLFAELVYYRTANSRSGNGKRYDKVVNYPRRRREMQRLRNRLQALPRPPCAPHQAKTMLAKFAPKKNQNYLTNN